MKPLARNALAAAQLFAMISWMVACGEQGEGERCDPRNGKTADCVSGLVCRTDVLGAPDERNGGICCPPLGEPTDVTACFPKEFAFDGGAGGSGGVSGDAAVDGGASADARSDAGIPDATPIVDSSADSTLPDGRADARADAP